MSDLTLDEYQEQAWETATGDISLERFILAVNAEAGELAEAYVKWKRGDYGIREMQSRVADELGDLLWTAAAVATMMDERRGWVIEPATLGEIATENLTKLADRAERGVIQGDGDDR